MLLPTKNDYFMHGCVGGMMAEIKVCIFTSMLSQTIKYTLNHNIKVLRKKYLIHSYIYVLVSFK